MNRASRASVARWALLLVCSAACGGASTPTSAVGPTEPAGQLVLAPIRFGSPTGEITLDEAGRFAEAGAIIGTISRDGGFVNAEGVEIGRLTPEGVLYFAGRRESATIDDAHALRDGGELVASIDDEGQIVIHTGDGPVRLVTGGVTPATARTAMFMFAMYSGLIHLAGQAEEAHESPEPVP